MSRPKTVAFYLKINENLCSNQQIRLAEAQYFRLLAFLEANHLRVSSYYSDSGLMDYPLLPSNGLEQMITDWKKRVFEVVISTCAISKSSNFYTDTMPPIIILDDLSTLSGF